MTRSANDGVIVKMVVIAAMFAAGCEDSAMTDGWTTDPREAHDPSGATPLAQMDEATVLDTLVSAQLGINEARPLGMATFISALKAELTRRGKRAAIVDRIDDNTIGKPMPGGTVARKPVKSKSSAIGSNAFALNASAYSEYYSCPILAPENNSGTQCDELVQSVVVQVKNEMHDDQGNLLGPGGQAPETNPALPAASQSFISAWYIQAYEYGIDVAAIYAAYELRATAACDDKSNAEAVATALGKEQGWQIVESNRQWALQQMQTCVVNVDAIAEQVRTMSKNQVSTFMTENAVCTEADISSQNQALQTAENMRRQGILDGIDERVEILRNELFQAPTPASCGGGEGEEECKTPEQCERQRWRNELRRRQRTGEPLVIDLDGDGLKLRNETVSFDLFGRGSAQRVAWIGAREGFVVIDADGDGAVNSVAEMMGNRSDCGGSLCHDGIAALSAYDSADRGGNGDGVIDATDQVFDKLQIWVDGNSDGISQPAELSSFAERGILAISLEATICVQQMEGGTLAGKLQVLTTDGFRDAYDVWLDTQI